jgi:hypothetical protein
MHAGTPLLNGNTIRVSLYGRVIYVKIRRIFKSCDLVSAKERLRDSRSTGSNHKWVLWRLQYITMASETPPKVAAATEENEKIPTSDGMGADADGSPETGTSEDRHDFSDHDTDDDDDNDDEFNGQSLLPGMTDHFSLPKESCLVRSRKKGNSVRV